MTTENPEDKNRALRVAPGGQAGNKLDNIIKDLVNFLKWESEQDWEPDYDREANRQNSINRTIQTLEAYAERLATEREIEVLEKLYLTVDYKVMVHGNGDIETDVSLADHISALRATLTGKADHE